ncbi:CPBP family intramembrane glutamic endopeptidase [Thomasclavelia cocleata]|jgi:membrane protease YdiL (CAAX protease family)|uniref:CPBP family intramembrane glutamic endopeptidase n=1 Tax=Thomasclavelia cocleata TaxID=69824 RepID=UPI00242BB808|nr:type II CAAX endopeptidase family protein [Thomasclavelia cocleata]MCI9630114.1 CPBP family intramembrane metalloprotease [Thomasclavelia cocleata]
MKLYLKINSWINQHTVASALLIYFIGYLFLGGLIIATVAPEYTIYVQLVITIIIFLMIIRVSKDYFEKNFVSDTFKGIDKSILLGIYTFLLVIIGLIFSYLNSLFVQTTTLNQESIILSSYANPLITGFIVILLLPFIEDLLFKYHLYTKTKTLKNHWLIKTSVIAILFATLHCLSEIVNLNPYIFFSLANYFIFYVITNFIYLKYDNLMFSIIIHCLYNAVSFILIFN